jgi:aspartyl-tRNA(Asn)/glutamyl-tRNA(Gln) amidotransferase subunit C
MPGPTLTRQEVEEIALLARLHLDDAEITTLQTELGAILEHFAVIAQAQTDNVPAMTHVVNIASPLRADVAEPSLPVEVALKAVPKKAGDLIVVPAIITDRGAS